MGSALEDLQTIGLFYDLVGILILGVPLAKRGTTAIVEQASTHWDINLPAAEEAVSAKLDATFGTMVLALGFLMQIVARFTVNVPLAFGCLCLAALAGGASVYYLWWRRHSLQRHTKKILELAEYQAHEAT